jgi:hypothetical protein
LKKFPKTFCKKETASKKIKRRESKKKRQKNQNARQNARQKKSNAKSKTKSKVKAKGQYYDYRNTRKPFGIGSNQKSGRAFKRKGI